jgi:hypothetical protein
MGRVARSACLKRCLKRTEHPEAVRRGTAGDVGGVAVSFELVRQAGAEVELDRYTGSAETQGVIKVFVTKDVELTTSI